MTFFLFFIGVIFGLFKGGNVRLLTGVMVISIGIYSLAHYVGLDFGDQSRVILLLPILAAVIPSAFPKFSGSKKKRFMIAFMLLLVLVIPYFSQNWIFPRKVYIVMPEYRAGRALSEMYEGGKILVDSPVVVYASRLQVNQFISYETRFKAIVLLG